MHSARIVAFLAAAALFLAGCREDPFSRIRPEGYPFPDGFLWGVAVAAHQVEGGNDRNDWWAWEQQEGRIKYGHRSGDAVGFARVFEKDIQLAHELGQNAFRLSLEWSRLQPERGKIDPAAVQYYHDVLSALRRHGLRPFVTVLHFTLPQWIAAQGGWESAGTIADFAAFARFCGREFGAEVDDWITINEPNVYAFKGYDEGTWPPGKKDRAAAVRVIAAQMLGHARAARALRDADTVAVEPGGKACRVGLANHVVVLDPWNAFSPIDQIRANVENQVFNMAAMEAVQTGKFVADLPGTLHHEVADPDLAHSVDFVGINYYTRRLASGLTGYRLPEGAQKNDLDWEIYPDGLYRWLERIKRQALPIYITENGVADHRDALRARFVVQHLQRVWQAIDAGIPVKGYFHWSLMDNFEWAEGFEPRFGLYRVDFERSNTSRQLTRGGEVYGRIARANKISAELVREYGF